MAYYATLESPFGAPGGFDNVPFPLNTGKVLRRTIAEAERDADALEPACDVGESPFCRGHFRVVIRRQYRNFGSLIVRMQEPDCQCPWRSHEVRP